VRFPSRRRRFVAPAFALTGSLVLLAACGGGGDKKTGDTKPISATSTTVAPVIAPLSGTLDPSGASQTRAALTIKIDNTKRGQPKYGVEAADVVYEEIVEGDITRLAAIFNSQAPDRVGPVRSVRLTDQSIVWPIGGIFAYSGGAKYAQDSIETAPVLLIDETSAQDGMFRDHSREAPWNLYADTPKLFARGGEPVPPPPLFVYRAANAPVTGEPASSVHVGFKAGFDVTWTWDVASGGWNRQLFGAQEMAASGAPLAPKNVVVLFVDYPNGTSQIGAEANLVGSGTAWVFTGGKVVKGSWERPEKEKPAVLLDASGSEIELAPGQTWVELPRADYPVTVTP
jgi:hypothetical protein